MSQFKAAGPSDPVSVCLSVCPPSNCIGRWLEKPLWPRPVRRPPSSGTGRVTNKRLAGSLAPLPRALSLCRLAVAYPDDVASEALVVSGAHAFLTEDSAFLFDLQTESEYLHQRGQQVCAAAVPVEDQGLGSRERPHLEPRFLHLRQ